MGINAGTEHPTGSIPKKIILEEKERSLKDLFHLIKDVLPEEQTLITFSPEKPVIEALNEMRRHNFSQVPVLKHNEVLGVFSYRSFAENVINLPENERRSLSVPVEEFLEDLKYAQIKDEVIAFLDEFELKDAILVGLENRLQGIITTIDVLRYFYKIASPYIVLREIELAIRELIRISVTESELEECINRSIKKHYEENDKPVPTCLEEMTLNDYVMLLRFKRTWERFSPTFGKSSSIVYAKLEPLPTLRNDIFHHRRELRIDELAFLMQVRDWLLKKVRKVEAQEVVLSR